MVAQEQLSLLKENRELLPEDEFIISKCSNLIIKLTFQLSKELRIHDCHFDRILGKKIGGGAGDAEGFARMLHE